MVFIVVQVIVSILLIAVVLFQMQGSGLSSAFGGGGEFYRSKQSIEKILVWITVLLSVIFAVLSVILLLPSGK